MSEGTAELPLLDVRELTARIGTPRGDLRAVDGVSFTLAAGRTMGVVGETGSGKSMLLRSIMGLTGHSVERSGRVVFAGRDLTDLPPRQLRRYWGTEMALVLQNPLASLNPVTKVGAQVAETLRVHGRAGRAEATAIAVDLLRSVGIPDPARRARQYPHELSGGMRQRVAIAAALACSPRLLLADEPTTALDVTVQAQILDLLDAQRSQRDMAMILVTHDLSVVGRRADVVAVMYAGQIVEQAPAAALFAGPRMPYTSLLMKSVPRVEQPPHGRLAAIPGSPPDLAHPRLGCRFAPRCPFVRERCREEEPPLVPAGPPSPPGHVYRCWYPLEPGR